MAEILNVLCAQVSTVNIDSCSKCFAWNKCYQFLSYDISYHPSNLIYKSFTSLPTHYLILFQSFKSGTIAQKR